MEAAVLDFGVSFAEHSRRAGSPSAAALQRTRAILSARMAPAEVQARGFGRPAAVEVRGAWQWVVAAGAILVLSVAGAFYLKETIAPQVTEPAVAAVLIGAGASGAAGIGSNPFAVPRAATSVAAPMATGNVRREGDWVVIDLRDVPLAQAIAELASVTQTVVVGQPSAVRVSLQWRGQGNAAAWHALLAGESGYALACGLPESAANCRVWLAANPAALQ